MIRRLLIANRGEVALRVIRACRELGVETVAVYSEADVRAPHVSAADRAVAIGPAPAVDSYHSTARILEAVDTSGADAVHPGYGFLSENASFAAACEQAGLVFVGPPSGVIAQMGSKIAARRVMQTAGVPSVPGDVPHDQIDDAIAAIQGARREATASFGDGTLYVEKLLVKPHHVEVQIFADNHDHVVHLWERECSAQRRHQKVVEESPSPIMTARLRARMTDAAVQAARACGYRNAGTVEFLVDTSMGRGAERFYFLEMNTRLQVEHPITEQVTGLDIVRAQILVASNEPLPWLAPSISQRGHAIEARVYAEDPAQGFLPQAGRLLLYREPRIPGIRIDSGVEEGSDVPVHYDALLAKVIATASTRDEAITRLVCALRAFPILGVRTNVSFLLRLLEHPRFRAGDVDTTFLDTEGHALAAKPAEQPPAFVREALAAYTVDADQLTAASASGGIQPMAVAGFDPWERLGTWRK